MFINIFFRYNFVAFNLQKIQVAVYYKQVV